MNWSIFTVAWMRYQFFWDVIQYQIQKELTPHPLIHEVWRLRSLLPVKCKQIWRTHAQSSDEHILKTVAIYLDSLSLHAHAQALLVAAVLTSVALAFIDYTVLVFSACIWQILTYSSLEKTLASFTAGKTVQTLMLYNYSRNSLLIMKPEIYTIQNSPPVNSVFSWVNPAHIPTPYLRSILTFRVPSTPWSHRFYLFAWFSNWNCSLGRERMGWERIATVTS